MRASSILEGGAATAYDCLDLSEELLLHVGEDRHVEDEPLEKGGDRVRSGQKYRR